MWKNGQNEAEHSTWMLLQTGKTAQSLTDGGANCPWHHQVRGQSRASNERDMRLSTQSHERSLQKTRIWTVQNVAERAAAIGKARSPIVDSRVITDDKWVKFNVPPDTLTHNSRRFLQAIAQPTVSKHWWTDGGRPVTTMMLSKNDIEFVHKRKSLYWQSLTYHTR